MAEPAYPKARADLLTAAHRVLHSPELLTQILHHLDKDTLARASSVSKFFYWECARHLWSTCASLNPLMFNVPVQKHQKIAQLVCNLHLKEDEHLWPEGAFTSIPVFPCLRSLSVHALSLSTFFDTTCVSNLLPATILQLSLTTDTQIHDLLTASIDVPPLIHAPWLPILHQRCS